MLTKSKRFMNLSTMSFPCLLACLRHICDARNLHLKGLLIHLCAVYGTVCVKHSTLSTAERLHNEPALFISLYTSCSRGAECEAH